MKKKDFRNFNELLEQHAGLSFQKQTNFGKVIGNSDWEFDIDAGTITFGDLSFPIQVIGTLAFSDNSWLWAWANKQSNIPENLLIQANKLREIGEQKNIPELKNGNFYVDKNFEHKIGMIAGGVFSTKAYYCANYGQGTLVVTIDDSRIPEIDLKNIENILVVFDNLIQTIELNHKEALKNYLIDCEFLLEIHKKRILGQRNNRVIRADFDKLNRLTGLRLLAEDKV